MEAYSSNNLTVIVNGVSLQGFAGGDDAITAKYATDRVTHVMGIDGGMAISVAQDRSGEVGIKLMQTSPSNKYLLDLAHQQGIRPGSPPPRDLAIGAPQGPTSSIPIYLTVQDSFRQDKIRGNAGYIKTVPDIARGAGINVHEWVFVFRMLDVSLGAVQRIGLL